MSRRDLNAVRRKPAQRKAQVSMADLPFKRGNLAVNQGKLGVEQARLGLARNADARAAANEGQPSLVVDPVHGDIFSVNKRTGVGQRVVDAQGNPLQGPTKPLTEAQSNAVMFGIRAEDADKTMRQMEAGGFNPAGPGMAKDLATANRITTNWMASAEGQKYIAASKNLVGAILRKESGAQINAGEWKMGQDLYVPMPGDSDEVRAQKMRNRELAIAGLRAAAGQGEGQIDKRIPPSGKNAIDSLLDKYAPR